MVAIVVLFASLGVVSATKHCGTHAQGVSLLQHGGAVGKLPAHGNQVQHQAARKAEEKWLFGSASHPLDRLPIDHMLPHQLKESSGRPFDLRVLYSRGPTNTDKQNTQVISDPNLTGDKGPVGGARMKKQRLMIERIKSMQEVDEIISAQDINRTKLFELARQVMTDDAAKMLLSVENDYHDRNQVMVLFLAKCLDGGFDHCAWLDSDVFVHKGQVPWVDEAVQEFHKNPEIMVGTPSHAPMIQGKKGGYFTGFSSRHFVYHTRSFRRLLPLSVAPNKRVITWETLIERNLEAKSVGDTIYVTSNQSGSWAIHPPDSHQKLDRIIKACMPAEDGLQALIHFIEGGDTIGEDAYRWPESSLNHEQMDANVWAKHLHRRCKET